MFKKYTKDELWSIFEKLPEELKYAIFAEETATQIRKVADRYGLEKHLSDLSQGVGNVFFGLLSVKDFEDTIKENIDLDKTTLSKLNREIYRLLFYPVLPALEKISKNELESEEVKKEVKVKSNLEEDKYRELVD